MEREVFGDVLKGTEKQLQEMYDLVNYGYSYTCKEFKKYFHVWVHEGTGVYYFPKERYFVSRNGETNYAVALLSYGGRVKNEIYGK